MGARFLASLVVASLETTWGFHPTIAVSRRMTTKVYNMALGDAKRMLEGGDAVLVDVREPKEWTEDGHFKSATNVPFLSQLQGGDVPKDLLSEARTVLVHCAKGGRAVKAADLLAAYDVNAIALTDSFPDLKAFPLDEIVEAA